MEDYIAANPDVVRGFVKAVKQGFEYTAAHPQDAVALMKKHQPQLNADTALKELPILARLSTSDDTKAHGFGIMTESKMQETADLIAKYMDLKSEVPIHDLYTNDFLS